MRPASNWAVKVPDPKPKKGRRLLQIHPSLLCNFRCVHCYSASSPLAKGHLNLSYVAGTIENAYTLGYENLSVSGGEPLLYPFLKETLALAKCLGMSTSLITNGSFPRAKYEELAGLVDTIGVSVDGMEERHNAIRGNKNAFRKVDAFLDVAKDLFPSVGISFTLTDQSWEDLPALVGYAETRKVDLLQIYPLEKNGYALEGTLSVSDETLMRAYVLYRLLAQQSSCKIHFNCFSRTSLEDHFYGRTSSGSMADMIDLVVLNEHGSLLPYTYGLDPVWRIASKDQPLNTACWQNYRDNLLPGLDALCHHAYWSCFHSLSYFPQYYDTLRRWSSKLKVQRSRFKVPG